MNLTYEQAMEYLQQLPAFSPKAIADKTRAYNLDRIRILLKRLGNPQENLTYIHIAGTNGKGSTSAFLQNILTAAHYRTGSFNSPQLLRYTEQIRIDGTEISEECVARLFTTIKEHTDAMVAEGIGCPSEFELTLTAAILYFVEQHCDLVILEAGMGGTYDATNIIPAALLSIITTISLDHMQILGDTLPEIAQHKAGIIKPGTTVLLYPQEPEVENIFIQVCARLHASLHPVQLPAALLSQGLYGQQFRLPQALTFANCDTFHIPLLGNYQPNNAATALCACELLNQMGYPISFDTAQQGLLATRWPGRFELLQRDPVLLVDGAHNLQGIELLVQSLFTMFPERNIHLVVGVLADKQYEPMMQCLLTVSSDFITFSPPSARALSGEILAEYIRSQGGQAVAASDVIDAVTLAKSKAASNDIICICGSLYFIGQLREHLHALTKGDHS